MFSYQKFRQEITNIVGGNVGNRISASARRGVGSCVVSECGHSGLLHLCLANSSMLYRLHTTVFSMSEILFAKFVTHMFAHSVENISATHNGSYGCGIQFLDAVHGIDILVLNKPNDLEWISFKSSTVAPVSKNYVNNGQVPSRLSDTSLCCARNQKHSN